MLAGRAGEAEGGSASGSCSNGNPGPSGLSGDALAVSQGPSLPVLSFAETPAATA